jgi:hypothetical protein
MIPYFAVASPRALSSSSSLYWITESQTIVGPRLDYSLISILRLYPLGLETAKEFLR